VWGTRSVDGPVSVISRAWGEGPTLPWPTLASRPSTAPHGLRDIADRSLAP
jgi:hypothetical protein